MSTLHVKYPLHVLIYIPVITWRKLPDQQEWQAEVRVSWS